MEQSKKRRQKTKKGKISCLEKQLSLKGPVLCYLFKLYYITYIRSFLILDDLNNDRNDEVHAGSLVYSFVFGLLFLFTKVVHDFAN
jgi:hypothetical protein